VVAKPIQDPLVGSRLASFQDESPVHRFKTPKTIQSSPASLVIKPAPKTTGHQLIHNNPTTTQQNTQLEEEDDFGDFTASLPPVLPKPVQVPGAQRSTKQKHVFNLKQRIS
jgi:hypothetical protein